LSSSYIGASYSAAEPALEEAAWLEGAPTGLAAAEPAVGEQVPAEPAMGGPVAAEPVAAAPAVGAAQLERVSREEALEAVLAAPVQGSVAAAYQLKEAAFRAELVRLPAVESRVLAERLRRASPGDRLASMFGRMTAERRGRLLAYLDDARRREAVRATRAPRAKGAPSAEV
jgi:hypothetical protein